MSLRLRVVSEQRLAMGSRATVEFDAIGGTIGRSADNDWVLPDPNRYVSGHHARIRFRDGSYLLEDLSTNGVFVNDESEPISAGDPHPLRHGDVLRIGEYHVVVAVDAAGPWDGDSRALADQPPPAATGPEAPVAVSLLEPDIGVSLDIADVLNLPAGETGDAPPAAAAADPVADSRSDSGVDIDSAAVARRLEALARAAARRDRIVQGGAPAGTTAAAGLEAFCRGAGIAMTELPAEAQARILSLAGQLMREALVGLKDLQRTRQEQRNQFRIDLPLDLEDTRPALAATTVEDLLVALLTQHESRRINAVDWLRGVVDETRRHEEASTAAMREAFVGFVDRLAPDELESRFARSARRNRPEGAAQASWDLYKDFYRNLAEMPPDGFPRTFVESFVDAYVNHLTKVPER